MECEKCHSEIAFGLVTIDCSNTVLDQIAHATNNHASEWTFTTGFSDLKETTFLRLCFTLDENDGDVDCLFFMRFEVKPPGADAFEVLGSAEVIPFYFSREGRGPGWYHLDRCFCDFPAKYRNEFFHMVTQLGEVRCLALFG